VNSTWAAKTCSLFLAAAGASDIAVPAGGGTFLFRDVKAWRYSEARQEMVPELAAQLENETGQEWREAIFRVKVPCPENQQQSFVVKLNGVKTGAHEIRSTAFEAIGRIAACEPDTIGIEFLGGSRTTVDASASYVVLGFCRREGDRPPSLALEGIYETRSTSEINRPTRPIFLSEGGEALGERPGDEPMAYYAFRVEPGEVGLSGFLPSSTTPPLENFIRWYTVPPGKAVFVGSFEMSRTASGVFSVIVSRDPAGFQWVKSMHPLVHGREISSAR
jgi:hypothetical protein